MSNKMKWKIVTCELFILLFHFTNSVNGGFCSQSIDQRKKLKGYYSFLESIAFDSQPLQIQKSKNYLEENPDFSRIYFHLFHHYAYNDKIKEAETYFDSLKTISIYQKNSLWVLADIYNFQDNYPKAFDCYKQAIQTGQVTISLLYDFVDFIHCQEQNYNQQQEIENLNLDIPYQSVLDALYHYKNTNYSKAIDKLENSLNDFPKNPTILRTLGICYRKLINYKKSEFCFQQILNFAENNGDLQGEINSLISLGINNIRQKDRTGAAFNNLETSLSNAKKINDLSLIQSAMGNLGILYSIQGECERAIELLENARTVAEKIGYYKNVAHFYMAKAQCLKNLNKLQESLIFYEKSEELAQKVNDKDLIVSLSREKTSFFRIRGLDNLAKHEYQKVYEAARIKPLQNLNYRIIYLYADLLMEIGDYDRARDLYWEVLNLPKDKILKIDRGYCHFNLGRLNFNNEKYDQAEIHYQTAYDLAKVYDNEYSKYFLAHSKLRLARIETKNGNFSRALSIFNEDIINEVGKKKEQVKIDQNHFLGILYKEHNKPNKAIHYFTNAYNLIEKQRKKLKVDQFRIGYFSENVKTCYALVKSYLERYLESDSDSTLENLFYFLGTSRARGLQDLIITDKSMDLLKKTIEYENYQKACLELQTFQRKIRDNPQHEENYAVNLAIARYELLNKRLQFVQEKIQDSQNLIISLKSALAQLDTIKTGLLLYHITNDVSFVLAACNKNVEIVKLPTTPSFLTAAIDSLMSPFHDISSNSIDKVPFRAELAHRLYKLLLQPIEEKMTLPSNLLIVPDRALVGLPFEMLLTKPTELKEYTPVQTSDYSNHFLLQRYSILYSPFTWLKLDTKDSSSKKHNILVFANP